MCAILVCLPTWPFCRYKKCDICCVEYLLIYSVSFIFSLIFFAVKVCLFLIFYFFMLLFIIYLAEPSESGPQSISTQKSRLQITWVFLEKAQPSILGFCSLKQFRFNFRCSAILYEFSVVSYEQLFQ